jgi:uncharacterized Fe-S cluster-containing protein
MKKQDNMSPTKINNSTMKDLNDNQENEISNNELKTAIIRMGNKIEEDMYMHLNIFKEDTNKQLNESKTIQINSGMNTKRIK